ncbi:MAG: S-layer homology domain-containing protein [Clostridia bacterium]|nr:S-layer homology domain-containing protein [Clostridia bacterium]
MNAKKLLSAVLAALMLVSVCITGISAKSALPFTDVVEGEWYYDAVAYTYAAGLMNGTGDGTKFSPMMNLTRGMVVTVLYRNDGAPKGAYSNKFVDVAPETYYETPAAWALAEGIVTGTGTDEWGDPLFSPDRNITRQELATMIGRYAAYCHVDTAKDTADISTFPDAGKVASWASDTFKWAAGTGIITGKGTGASATLSPEDLATRAEFATIIKRFNDKDAERVFTYKLAYTAPVEKSHFTEKEYLPVEDADIYVATDGLDTNPGTKEKPLATFEAAKNMVRTLEAGADGKIVVAFKAGNYGGIGDIKFEAADSGSADRKIIYCAYGDGDVVFEEGTSIRKDEFVPVDESDYYLLGNVDTSKVYKVCLDGKSDKVTQNSIFFRETGLCHEARIPNKSSDGTDRSYANMTTTHDPLASIELQLGLPAIVESFRTVEGMKVTGFLRTGWIVDTFPVKSYDKETHILTFDFENAHFNHSGLGSYPLADEDRMTDTVFFSNLSDQIDSVDEYWFNPATNTLYMYKPYEDIFVATGSQHLYLDDMDYITFSHLDFIGNTGTTFEVGGTHLTFDGCTFGNVAGDAVIRDIFQYDVTEFTVVNCEFYGFVCKGIEIDSSYDSLRPLIPTNLVIENNYFHDFGLPQYTSEAVALECTVDSKVAHNEFVNGSHAAIRWDRCIGLQIEYNIFDNMMTTTEDYGAVYTYNSVTDRDNIIRYNIFRNIRTNAAVYGVYLDDNTSGQEICYNIFYDAGAHAVTFNGGRDNRVHDNVVINTKENYSGDFIMHNPGLYGILEANDDPAAIKAELEASVFYERITGLPKPGSEHYDTWKTRWPDMFSYSFDPADIDDPKCIFHTVQYITNNAVINKDKSMDYGEYYEMFAVKDGTVAYGLDENPFFADPTHGDYTITDTSKFADNQFDKIGRY